MQQTSEQKQNKIQKNKGGFSMFKKMNHMKNEKGLTLIELLAVIVILAIVAAIAIPSIGNIVENQRIKAIKADAANIISAAQLYYADNGTTTGFSVTAGSSEFVDLGNTTINTTVTVNSKGEITAGKITKNGKILEILTFTTPDTGVSIADLEVDQKTKTGTGWKID